MTEEERIQLLIEELCPRLPYGVRGTVPIEIWNGDWGEDGFQIFVTKHVEVELTAVDTWSQDIRVETVGSDFDVILAMSILLVGSSAMIMSGASSQTIR